jgi:phage terminase small subunit
MWKEVCEDFDLEQRHLVILARACVALDRATRAGRQVTLEGEVVRDRFGQPKANPACAIERDADASFRHSLHELGLDVTASGSARKW